MGPIVNEVGSSDTAYEIQVFGNSIEEIEFWKIADK